MRVILHSVARSFRELPSVESKMLLGSLDRVCKIILEVGFCNQFFDEALQRLQSSKL